MASPAYNFRSQIGYPQVMNRGSLSDHLEGLENFLFDPVARRDVATVSSLLTEDFREFGSSGRVYTKLDILAELTTEQPVVITLTDFACELVSPSVALVTYKSLSSHDNRSPSQALRSSIWVQRPGERYAKDAEPRWQMLFHQGTRF